MTDLTVVLAGQAGQGLQAATRQLARVLVRSGHHVFASADVMSRIRGGDNSNRVRVTDFPVGADSGGAELLVALEPGLVARHLGMLVAGGLVVVGDDGPEPPGGEYRVLRVPFKRLGGRNGRMVNTAALGVVAALCGIDRAALLAQVSSGYEHKGEEVVRLNAASFEGGYRAASDSGVEPVARFGSPEPDNGRLLVSGAEALALGAVAGGIALACGYPMSPGTAVLEALAGWSSRTGMVVEQPEDEVAAVNLALGAAFAGRPALVATAGGGLSLMNEGLSLAGMTETPLVVMSGMRPGPATGLATRTAQADLLSAASCGHGEFARAVLCPGDATQAFAAGRDAALLAEEFQTPVLVLFDQFLADGLWTVDGFEFPEAQAASGRQGSPGSYRRYEPSDSGVSRRILPGTRGELVYADSDEHTAEGHITESAEVRVEQSGKRLRKLVGLAGRIPVPERYPDRDARTLVACFGSTRWAVREAVDRLRAQGQDIGMLHLPGAWPFPAEPFRQLARAGRRLVTVEGNLTGQLAALIRQETGMRADPAVRRYDGRPLTVADVEEGLASDGTGS